MSYANQYYFKYLYYSIIFYSAGVAQMLGAPKTGQLLDEVSSHSEAGNATHCLPDGDHHSCIIVSESR